MTLIRLRSMDGTPLRPCAESQVPHPAHKWRHPEDGLVACGGRPPLPDDAEERYCSPGCRCEFCVGIRAGLRPRLLMCTRKWAALPIETRVEITDSIDG